MLLRSNIYNDIEIKEEEIIKFKNGLYGLEHLKKFVLLGDISEPSNSLMYLHSTEDENICFLLVNPYNIVSDYDYGFDDNILNLLECEEKSDIMPLCIVVINKDIHNSTFNMRSPVLINKIKKLGLQVILDNNEYGIRQKLFDNNAKGVG